MSKRNPKRVSIVTRNLLTVVAGIVALIAVGAVVLYGPIMYGDMVDNYGIVMMMTLPVIVAVAFRIGLDAWLDR
ncbi:hypothetical protein FAZ95_13590 [Trinickia violacea]|uniref:Uncharacterized protein n=1 Tax=Trinickia violacea TaxID=2571746 RepID=A0A4P8IP69_9BURK|nr:hypothetical protein [Trinickia violacea]QCP50116.1 hypothetical protein FAZ95_13590 [Trinickia violacea]